MKTFLPCRFGIGRFNYGCYSCVLYKVKLEKKTEKREKLIACAAAHINRQPYTTKIYLPTSTNNTSSTELKTNGQSEKKSVCARDVLDE